MGIAFPCGSNFDTSVGQTRWFWAACPCRGHARLPIPCLSRGCTLAFQAKELHDSVELEQPLLVILSVTQLLHALSFVWGNIYIYIYAVRLLSGPSLGVFGSYYLVQVGFLEVIIWSKFVFLAYKNSGFKRFVLHTQLSFCVFFLSPILWQFSENSLFQKRGAKIGFSNFQCFKFRFSKFSFFRFAKTL